jgi:hypothetical protein
LRQCQPSPTHEVINPDNDSDSDEFHVAESDLPETAQEGASDENFIREVDKGKGKDPFQTVAAHLYRTQLEYG